MPNYTVKGYARAGGLLQWTTHKNEPSMQVEVEAWKSRMAKDQRVAYVEVVDHNAGTTRVIHREHAAAP